MSSPIRNLTDVLPQSVRPVAKALVAVAAATFGCVLLALEPAETLADLTTYDVLTIVGTVLGTGGLTYHTRNDSPTPDVSPRDAVDGGP